jgi:uncharacterized protein YbjT (DUF2867 family)
MSTKKIIAIMGATGAQGGGLARAIAADKNGGFTARAITRKPDSDKAKALRALGIEVVEGDADDQASLERAFAGAYGVFCVTNFWETFSVDREGAQAIAMARATRKADVQHAVWSTLEDTREWIPISEARMPVLQAKYYVPHFDSKGQIDKVFANEGAPTSYLYVAFYWENFIYFGMQPRRGEDGQLTLSLPLGGAKLPGIAAEDVGKCAYGVFRRGARAVGERFGVAGEILSGDEMATKMGRALGQPVKFADVPFDVWRGLGFPGAEDIGNMFEFQAIVGDEFLQARSPELSRELNPSLQTFDTWLAANARRLPIE